MNDPYLMLFSKRDDFLKKFQVNHTRRGIMGKLMINAQGRGCV